MIEGMIQVRNAHANNLKNVDIDIPKHRVVVFTGVSGSGKSSLLFDTIYTEAQRQLIETFSSFARTRMPKLSRPDVDDIANLSTPIVIDQRPMGKNLRSTVGTATEVNTYLRLLYSRAGEPNIGPSFLFSFNHPEGMCPACHGLGSVIRVDPDLLLDRGKSIREGAITHPHYKVGGFLWKELVTLGVVDPNTRLADLPPADIEHLLYAEAYRVEGSKEKLAYNRSFEGIARKLEKAAAGKAEAESDEGDKDVYERYLEYRPCGDCRGTRLNPRARSVRLGGLSLDELCRMELTEARRYLGDLEGKLSRALLSKVLPLLDNLIEIGVGYLSLDRATASLSGGESQRVKLARQLDCNLVDLLYVLDEPSIGLHARDTERLIHLLFRLKEKGNSVFVVEHDPDIIRAAEWIVDMGPAAGREGGRVVYNGEAAGLAESPGLTAAFLSRAAEPCAPRREPKGFFELEGLRANNLKDLSVRIPKGLLCCVTGVAGSGKSSLIHDCFAKAHPEAVLIDQSPVGRSSRATIATYSGIFDAVRELFSRATGASASLFSFNSAGACPKCGGQGHLSTELHFLDAVRTVCDECEGRRYRAETLELRLRGKHIAEVLEMTAVQAIDFFPEPKIAPRLKLLEEVGLGYISLGQSVSSLSGGEAQRLKIASELGKQSGIYIMDEPTTGLHMSDIDRFQGILDRLVGGGNSVIVIEHNLDIVRRADWVIDMGPEGGEAGGRILYQGRPEGLAACEASITGRFLKDLL